MLDIIGSIALTALAVTGSAALILASPLDDRAKLRLAGVTGAWFVAMVGLAAAGLFSAASRVGTPAIGLAVVVPVLIVVASAVLGSRTRAVILGIPLTLLVAIHVGRLLGVFFLLLHAAGRIPPTFALSAGWGDIAVAVFAVPLAWAVHRRVPGWQTLTLAWNAVAFLDLVIAVTLGAGSAPGSPIRFIFEDPNASAIGTLPWPLIPGFLVPLYLLTHLAIFAQVVVNQRAAGRFSRSSGLAMKPMP
jgi:hypothetical protein